MIKRILVVGLFCAALIVITLPTRVVDAGIPPCAMCLSEAAEIFFECIDDPDGPPRWICEFVYEELNETCDRVYCNPQ